MKNFDESVQRRIEQLAAEERDEQSRRAAADEAQLQTAELVTSRLSPLVGERLFVTSQTAPAELEYHNRYVTEIRHRRTNVLLGYAVATLVVDSEAERRWYEANPDSDPDDLPVVPAYYFCSATVDDEDGAIYCATKRISEQSDDLEPHNLSFDLFLDATVSELINITALHERSYASKGFLR